MHRDILVHVSCPMNPNFSKSKERFLNPVCHLLARYNSFLEPALCFLLLLRSWRFCGTSSLSHCHFVHHRCHMNGPGINPRPPCWVADEVYKKSITSNQLSCSEMMWNAMLKARTVVQGNFESYCIIFRKCVNFVGQSSLNWLYFIIIIVTHHKNFIYYCNLIVVCGGIKMDTLHVMSPVQVCVW